MQLRLRNVAEAYSHLKPIAEAPDELPQQRHGQAAALLGAALAGAESGRAEDATALLERLPDFIRADDPEEPRRDMARTLAASSSAFCLVGHAQAGEMIARHAASTDPECAHGWSH